jgi:hypothetical protein
MLVALNMKLKISLIFIFFSNFLFQNSFGQVKFWDGGAATQNWSDANNWHDNIVPIPGDSVVLNHSYISGNYKVIIPNTTVTVKCIYTYPSSAGDSIYIEIPSTNNIGNNLSLTGVGFNALRLGKRARFNNNSGATSTSYAIRIADVANYGMLLDTGGYYYHGSLTRDLDVLQNLTTRYQSTFEYDKPVGSYDVMIFPVLTPIGTITFYNLIFSGTKAGVNRAYGGTIANNYNLVINGDLTVRNKASFGIVKGDVAQTSRAVYFRGNIIAQNTTATLWFEASAPISFGINAVFDGITLQTISSDVVWQEKVTVDNPAGIQTSNRFEIKTGFVFVFDPQLIFVNGNINTIGSGYVYLNLTNSTKISGHTSGGNIATDKYVNGKLRRAVSADSSYDFPVGASGNYQLCNISFSGMTGVSYVTTEFISTVLGTITSPLVEGGDNYQTPLSSGYWQVTPDAAMTGGNYTISLFQTGYSTLMSKLRVAKRQDTTFPWTLLGVHYSFTQYPLVASAVRSGLTSFSDFVIFTGGVIVPLPLELISFNAISQNGNTQLSWQVTNIKDVGGHFVIMRSTDAINWTDYLTVDTESNMNTYSVVDENPPNTTSYYKLRYRSVQGDDFFSSVEVVNATQQLFKKKNLFPNPFNDEVQFEEVLNNTDNIRLFDISGKDISNKISRISISNQYTKVEFQSLNAGYYILKTPSFTFNLIKLQ